MAGKNSEINKPITIPWPFAPRDVRLNRDTGFLKLIAIVLMFIDHLGAIVFPDYRSMRIIGRAAFPIFAYCMAVGMVYSSDRLAYIRRVILLAMLTQPIYAVSFGYLDPKVYSSLFAESPVQAVFYFYMESWTHPSILASITLGMLIIWALRERQVIIAVAVFVLSWKIQKSLDYGINGIILMLLLYVFIEKWYLSLPIVAAFIIWWSLQGTGYSLFGVSFSSRMFSLAALPLIYIPMHTGVRINKWVFYAFYPLHLAAIYLIDQMLAA